MYPTRARTGTSCSRDKRTNHARGQCASTVAINSSFRVINSLKHVKKSLLISSFEVTPVMATSFKQQSHVNITLQHSITHIHFLSGWLPFDGLLLHNWTIGGKVHTIKSNVIVKAVVDVFTQSDERKVMHRSITTKRYEKRYYLTVYKCIIANKRRAMIPQTFFFFTLILVYTKRTTLWKSLKLSENISYNTS